MDEGGSQKWVSPLDVCTGKRYKPLEMDLGLELSNSAVTCTTPDTMYTLITFSQCRPHMGFMACWFV